MTTPHQPLLDGSKTSYTRILLLIFTLVAIICSATLVSVRSVRFSSSSTALPYRFCERAVDQKSCSVFLSEMASNTTLKMKDAGDVLQAFLEQSKVRMQNAMNVAKKFKHRINNPGEQAALADCMELMESSMDRIMDSMVAVDKQDATSYSNAHAWLSSVLTNHVTCLDGLEGSARTLMEPGLNDLISRARTSLAIFVSFSPRKTKLIDPLIDGFPSWVSSKDRKLLQSLPNEIKANVVVAKDGSGKYKTLGEAVAAAPDKSKTRYIIYVKKGTYKENVEIGKNKKNLMIVGDGMKSTIITGSLNVIDGSTTFRSATVAAVGDGFMAQDIWFQNTAGPQKHQAVALRVGADQSVINRCQIDGYQDTLYTHSNRQFYRDSEITGTVDFIFGDAAVVFQNCKLVVRKPMDKQSNMVTAQGRIDPNQNTGTSIQSCNIIASSDLEPVKGSFKSYLGRPWKEY